MTIDDLLMQHGSVWIVRSPKELWRTDAQAELWLRFMNSSPYVEGHYGDEYRLLEHHASAISAGIALPANIVDLGCGDGNKARILLSGLAGKPARYIPVDANRLFAENAAMSSSQQGIPSEAAVWDFFDLDFERIRTAQYPNNFYLLLGNLNYPIEQITALFRAAVKESDAALLGTELMPDNISSVIEALRTNPHIKEWLNASVASLGFKSNELEFNPRFNFATGQIEYGSDILQVSRGFSGSPMNPGDRIVFACSYRPTESELRSWFSADFNVRLFSRESGRAALAFLTRK